MAMIVQLILLIRWRVCVVVHDGVVSAIVLLAGEGSSTIADDVTTGGGGDNQTMLFLLSRRHHRRHRRNSQPRTISSTIKVRTHALRTITHNINNYAKSTV